MKSIGIKIFQSLFNRRISRSAREVIETFSGSDDSYQIQVEKKLKELAGQGEVNFQLGETVWGLPLQIPLKQLAAHCLIVGTTGAGKSYLLLSILIDSLQFFLTGKYLPIGVLDAKGEMASKAIEYINGFILKTDEDTRKKLGEKIFIIDFSKTNPITPYNILHCGDMPAELLVNNRIETIGQIFRGSSALSARMKSILKYFMLLLIENELPITFFEKLCLDSDLVQSLAAKSQDERLRHYFLHRFPLEPKGTVLGLRQRVDSLFVSEGVRLSLSAQAAPDFQKLQDEGFFIIINVAGPQISRGTSEFLLRIILSDIQQSVFRRVNPSMKFLWALDEAQVMYKDPVSRENMNDLLTMARSFGTFFMLLTQSLTSAVRDADILNSILANIRWVLLLRSTLRDAKLIAPAIPIIGRQPVEKKLPYEKQKYLTRDQELKMRLEEITHLPERIGLLWLRSELKQAIKIKTKEVPALKEFAGCCLNELNDFMEQNPVGSMVSPEMIKNEIKELEVKLNEYMHDQKPMLDQPGEGKNDIVKILEQTYLKKTNRPQNDED